MQRLIHRFMNGVAEMTLKDWLDVQGKSAADFAELVGVHRSTVGHWLKGDTRPGREAVRQIEEVTNGAVTEVDFIVAARLNNAQASSVPSDEAKETREVAA